MPYPFTIKTIPREELDKFAHSVSQTDTDTDAHTHTHIHTYIHSESDRSNLNNPETDK